MSKLAPPGQPLSSLLTGISTYNYQTDPLITGLCLDSRQVKPGDCFFAYPGTLTDGRQYIPQALAAGAAIVLYEPHPDITPDQRCIPVVNIQQHIGTIASRFWAAYLTKLQVIGITGTNGKSTCAYWLSHSLQAAGVPSAMIGTIGIGPVGQLSTATLTTPDPISLYQCFAEFANIGINTIAMEVSSHSLCQHRVVGVPFQLAAFTNLSHEHLDYHGTMRDYAQAKARLFDFPSLQGAVINADDDVGAEWLQHWAKDYPLYAISCQTQVNLPAKIDTLQATQIQVTQQGLTCQVAGPLGEAIWTLPVMGRFNLYNALTCAQLLACSGVSWTQIGELMAQLPNVPGRMQLIRQPDQPVCVVDYAHTPDALSNALSSLRQHCQGKLWCVFGCGGDRDQAKRPAMGKVAAKLADIVILTNDNPRSQDPEVILQEIQQGINTEITVYRITDRAEAIATAINQAQPDDVILIAGKGHESTQTLADKVIPFSDVEHCRQNLGTKG